MIFKQGCPLCRGKQSHDTTTFTVDKSNMLVVVRNVPATVCFQCGESWILDSVAADLEEIVSAAVSKRSQLEVIDMAA